MPPKKRKKPTETEARAAVGKILVRVFDVPAVLRGTKPLKDLSGLVWVFGALGCIGFRLVITTISSNMMAKMAGSLYLRDSREFAVDLSKRVLLSAFSCSNSALSFWFRRRIEIEWQKKITDDLHRCDCFTFSLAFCHVSSHFRPRFCTAPTSRTASSTARRSSKTPSPTPANGSSVT